MADLKTDHQTWKYIKTTKSSSLSLISISKKLLFEKKITPEFLEMLSFITYEELLALKLEQTSKIMGTPYLGFSLWNTLKDICRDAIVKYAYSLGLSNYDAAAIIGISKKSFARYTQKYHSGLYFKDYIRTRHKKKNNVLITQEDELIERTYK